MNRITNFLKTKKKYWIPGIVLIVLVIFFVFGGGAGKTELFTVARANVEQSVVLSGKVETSDRADLGFAVSGRISQIFVKNNQKVSQGAVLAQLEIGDLLADLKIKQANLRSSDVSLEAAKQELEKVMSRENTKVESAYRTLLTDALELVPDDADYDVTAPTLGGIYDGEEGKYKINITQESVTSNDFKLLTFDLEKTNIFINKEGPTPLGTKGLYISFPVSDLIPYYETTWFLEIPNKTSSSYLANYNAYNEAKSARDLAIKEAESKYEKLLAEEENAGTSVAQAEIQKINAEIRKNTIHAPFSGEVTNIEKEVGENASVGERVISILGEDKLEVVLQVSELDVSRLAPGTTIKISLDAFPGEDFVGTLKTINSRETEVDGVPVYEAFVELESSEKIKTGMSANGTIVLATKENVLAIPSYLVKKADGVNTVEVLGADGKKVVKTVTLGILGTDNMVEITSGLSEGEQIISTPKK